MPYQVISEEFSEPQEESVLDTFTRGAARTVSRVGEQIAGFPGDVFSLINDFVARPTVKAITGKEGVPYEETPLGKVMPTSERHKQATTAKFGELVKPKNKYEEFIDEVVSNATSIFLPGAKQGKLAKGAFHSLAISTGANIAETFVKDVTSDEKKSTYAKLGTLALLSMFDKPRAAAAVGELYKPLEARAAQLSPISATRLESSLKNLKNKVSKGTLAKSEEFVAKEVDAVLGKIKNGKISPEEAWASKRSLNEKLSDLLFSIPKKADQQRARQLAKGILHELDNTLSLTAKQDPSFYKNLKAANKAYGTIAESNLVSKFIENNMKYNPLTHGLINVFQGSIGSYLAPGALPYAAGKIMYRIAKSPELAKHYGRVLRSSAMEDAAVMNREMRILDKKLHREQSKSRYEIID